MMIEFLAVAATEPDPPLIFSILGGFLGFAAAIALAIFGLGVIEGDGESLKWGCLGLIVFGVIGGIGYVIGQNLGWVASG